MTLPAQDIVERLRDYGLTLEESIVICDRRVVDEAAATISRLTADNEALRKERDRLANTLHLHAGDCASLNNEVELMRGHWQEAEASADALAQEVERFRAALTPSADTKVAYWGEFYMGITLRAGREEDYRRVQIPWDSIKEIMVAIRFRALQSQEAGNEG